MSESCRPASPCRGTLAASVVLPSTNLPEFARTTCPMLTQNGAAVKAPVILRSRADTQRGSDLSSFRCSPGKTDNSRKERTSVMPDHSVPARLSATITPAAMPLRKLEPDAISVTQDVVIGLASSAPAARTQVGMAFVEYALLIGFGIAGLIAVLARVPG